jgi:predicted RNase H-like HicB family nuclease
MKESARYAKIVEWSDEDQCFVGSAPDLILGGCHGPDERAVFEDLCQIVDEAIEVYKKEGKPLPPASRSRVAHGTTGEYKRHGSLKA